MDRRSGSKNASSDLDRLLRTLGVGAPSRVLHVRLGPRSANFLATEQLWWMAQSDRAGQPRAISIDCGLTPAGELPFPTGWFDFVVSDGVAERLVEPARFLAELCRVGRSGYIECRRSIAQIVEPDPTIRWLAEYECDTLFFRECDPTDAAIMEPLRRRMNARVSIASSMRRAYASPRLRPLIFIELVWNGRFKYRIIRASPAARSVL